MADPDHDHDPILDQIIREPLTERNQSLDEVARQEQWDLEPAIALSPDQDQPHGLAPQLPAEQTVPHHSLPQVASPKDTRSSSSKLGKPKYLEGTVKLTHVDSFHGDYVKFEDLIDKQNLERATLSTFVVEKEWLLSQLPSDKNICLIKHGQPTGAYLRNSRFIIVHPPMANANFGCFHIKLMLLYFNEFVRVVIGSANLVDHEWREVENIIFVQDFPRRTSGRLESAEKLPTFAKGIYDLLAMMGVPKGVNNALLSFEFSNAKVHIIASVSGSFDKGYRKYGFLQLGEIVKAIGAAADWDTGPTLECQTASLGALNTPWLTNFYRAACGGDPDPATETGGSSSSNWRTRAKSGVDPIIETGSGSSSNWRAPGRVKSGIDSVNETGSSSPWRASGSSWRASGRVTSGAVWSSSKASSQPSALPPVTVVYPSKTTVQESLFGEYGARTISLLRSNYKDTFPRDILRNCISKRPGALMHSKMILARLHTPRILENGMDDSDLVVSMKAIHVDDDPSTADGEQSSRVDDIKKSEADELPDELPEKSKRKTKKLVGWFYCGSHNFSQSAWGKLISRDTKIGMNNWELGVVVPLIEVELDDEKIREGKEVSFQSEAEENWLRGIPVPFMRPPPKYAEDDEPWIEEDL